METRPIHTRKDHQAALRELAAFFEHEPEPRSPEGDRFAVLLTLVEAYEAKNFPIDLHGPVEAIKFCMEQSDLTPRRVPLLNKRLQCNNIVLYTACVGTTSLRRK